MSENPHKKARRVKAKPPKKATVKGTPKRVKAPKKALAGSPKRDAPPHKPHVQDRKHASVPPPASKKT